MSNLSAPRFFNAKTETVCAWGLIVASLVFLVVFGILGLFRSGSFGFDFAVFHKAGVEFLQGQNPWLLSINTNGPFSYPPHIGAVIAVYGLLPFKIALGLHTLLNLCSIAIVAFLANHWFIGVKQGQAITVLQGLCLALVLGNPYIAHSVYEGQLSLPAVALLFLSWHFLQRERWLLAGIILGVATIKPQVAILYILWLLFSWQLRVLIVGGVVAVLLLIPSVVNYGVTDTFTAWFASMAYYAKQWANQPGSPHVVGMEGVFVSVGVLGSGVFLNVLSVLSVWWVYIKRQDLSPVFIVNLFLLIALTLIYGHDTDFVVLSLFFSYLVCLASNTQRIGALVIAGGLLALMFFPQRFIRMFDIAVLYHTRSITLLFCVYFMYRWERESTSSVVSTSPA